MQSRGHRRSQRIIQQATTPGSDLAALQLRSGPIVLVHCTHDLRFITYVAPGAIIDPCGTAHSPKTLEPLEVQLATSTRQQQAPAPAMIAAMPRLSCNLSQNSAWLAAVRNDSQSSSSRPAHLPRRAPWPWLHYNVSEWAERERTGVGPSLQHSRILHQSWRSCELPSRQALWRERCNRVLPAGWQLWLWTDEDNRELIAREFPSFLRFYDKLDVMIKRADAVRYFYLYRFGGVYMDTECAQS